MNHEEEEDVYSICLLNIEKGETLENIGGTLLNDNKYDDALVFLNKLIECSQFESFYNYYKYEVYFNKGFALWKLNRNSEAIECFDKCIEKVPMNKFAHLFKSFSLANLARFGEAQESFDKASMFEPADLDILAFTNGKIQWFFLILTLFFTCLHFTYPWLLLGEYFGILKNLFGTNVLILFYFVALPFSFKFFRILQILSWVIWVPFIKRIQYTITRKSLKKIN
jgi:tetratricopeptide (TPR) repeat protein